MLRTVASLRHSPDVPLTVKTPEGFAFYALYPEQYVRSALIWAEEHAADKDQRVLVVGVRSIGTTLSAVVAATLAERGWDVRRVTVRPVGHPFARRVDVASQRFLGAAQALVVDEGPGLSGSSLAATGEALTRAGYEQRQIAFLPAHDRPPGPAASPHARDWWSGTRRYTTPLSEMTCAGRSLCDTLADRSAAYLRCDPSRIHLHDLGGGAWRPWAYPDPSSFPPAFPVFERAKFLCRVEGRPGGLLWKFHGLAEAERAAARLEGLASRGWTPPPRGTALGFVATEWVEGERARAEAKTPGLLRRIGRYVADAARPALSGDEQRTSLQRLGTMLCHNTQEALGADAADAARIAFERAADLPENPAPAYGDGRLAPWEWVVPPPHLQADAPHAIWKTDCVGHEADHTLVGGQGYLWDLAGAVVEWELRPDESQLLLSEAQAGGLPEVNPTLLRFHLLAYSAFRMGLCSMCAVSSDSERPWLARAEATYRGWLRRLLECPHAPV